MVGAGGVWWLWGKYPYERPENHSACILSSKKHGPVHFLQAYNNNKLAAVGPARRSRRYNRGNGMSQKKWDVTDPNFSKE